MATGERKWASSSTRRGGMTVLGKVAVPKPINLPSQKLENHGMDPNVEIVPKGTLSWGSRSGSPASNPWGSSPLSINTDNGRPSSGGSGTRSSTGSSEKAYESTANARGSNSRPSSASGALASNQASGTTLRPHSADNRPGSSQLSRFAETSTENSGAWAAAGSGDNTAHLKNENFSLASGDFPTLGSEKDDPPKNAHPSPQGGDAVASARINSDKENHGRRDNPPYEDGRRPNMEKWHGDALQRNPNLPGPPQHFAPWHGAPVGGPPVGVWYRGPPGAPPYVPPGGPPYGPPGAPPYGPSGGPPYGPSNIPPYGPLIGPGGFPVEHPYYHPSMPSPSLGSSQPVPHHGTGPRGVHQNNGEMYRPSNPDGHFRSGMLMRPGFFPGPVPYEGHYPPPMGYCGPNDRDIPYLGPAGGPAVYDRHSTPNAPEHVNSQSASGRHGSNEKQSGPEQGTVGHRHNPREQYRRVLLKQQGEDHEWGEGTATNDSQFGKGYLRRPSSHEKDQGAGSNNGDKSDSRISSNEGGPIHGSHTHGHGGSQFHGRGRLTDEAKSAKGVSNVEKNVPDKLSSSEVVVAPKDSGLIKKIEGLNAKARGSEGKQDTSLNSNRDEGKSRSHATSNAPHFNNESVIHFKSHGGGIINLPSSHGIEGVGGSNSSRKYSNSGPQIRTDYRGKEKPDFLETDKNAHYGDFSTAVSSSKSDPVNLKVQDHRSNMVAGKSDSSLEGKDVVPDSESGSDPIDIQAQRAKKKEIAMQRAIQLQREEEERIKEQKAKAQAKLEELNRRTKSMENSTERGKLATEKAEIVTEKIDIVSEKAEKTFRIKEQKAKAQAKLEELNRRTNSMENSTERGKLATAKAEIVTEKTDIVSEKAEKTSSGKIDGKQGEVQSEQVSGAAAVLKPNTIVIGTRTLDPQLQIPKDDLHSSVTFPRQSAAELDGGQQKVDARGEPQHYGGKNNASKSKNKAYEEKQNFQHERVASEKTVKAAVDTLKYDNEAGEVVPKNATMLAEPEVHQRTKTDKSGKNKQKVEDTSSLVVIRSVAPKNSDVMKAAVDSGKPQSPNLAETTHGQPPVNSGDWTPSTEPHASQLKEEAQSRINNHSRYQNSRKQSRNPQGNRAVDKTNGSDTVVWAPVRQQNKEVIDDSSLKVVSEEAGDHIGKSDHAQSNIKNKRAEIERYVPKPVAKELAQQGGAQQPTSPGTNVTGSAATRVETAVENSNVDNNYNRQARAPGAWRQRGSAEASHRKGPKDNPLDYSVVDKDINMPDSHETQEEKKFSDGWNSPDEWNANAYKAPDASVPNLKDQESFNRGKRQYNKGTRNTGTYVHDREHHKGQTGKDVDISHSKLATSNSDERDKTAPHKEPHHDGGHPASHWQTRPHDASADNRRIRVGGVHRNSGRENTRFVKKEAAPHEDHFQSKDAKITDVVSDRPYAPTKTDPGSMATTGPQHNKRERKSTAAHQVGSYSSNPNPRAQIEQPTPIEHQHERPHSSSGMRKNSNPNNRNVRGQESQGEWNSFEQDRRHHNQQPSGRGRPRHASSHYEYKPKGQGQGQGHPASADGGNLAGGTS